MSASAKVMKTGMESPSFSQEIKPIGNKFMWWNDADDSPLIQLKQEHGPITGLLREFLPRRASALLKPITFRGFNKRRHQPQNSSSTIWAQLAHSPHRSIAVLSFIMRHHSRPIAGLQTLKLGYCKRFQTPYALRSTFFGQPSLSSFLEIAAENCIWQPTFNFCVVDKLSVPIKTAQSTNFQRCLKHARQI